MNPFNMPILFDFSFPNDQFKQSKKKLGCLGPKDGPTKE